MKDLSIGDYIKIYEFYKIPIPKTKSKKPSIRKMKKHINRLLAQKLCRCIKKVKSKKYKEGRAIAICTHSVFKRKGLRRPRFTCKKRQRLLRNTRKIR